MNSYRLKNEFLEAKAFSKNSLKNFFEWVRKSIFILIKWIIISITVGIIVGLVASAFHICLEKAPALREKYIFLYFMLPVFGLLIVLLYKILGLENDKGTNMVLLAVREGENMTFKNTVAIFISSVLTHLGGGSAGREGAALQIGGSIGSQIGNILKLKKSDHTLITMCGMSAGFSALFGTPLAASFFSMEVISVGIMHYSALVPCAISAIVGSRVSAYFGAEKAELTVQAGHSIDYIFFGKIALLAVLCGFLSMIFCVALKNISKLYRRFIKNPFRKVVIGGLIVVFLTLLIGNHRYNGSGMEYVKEVFVSYATPYDFIIKLILTALTLGAGYKGGEILPCFFVGSTFGSFMSMILGLDPSMGASIAMTSLFCGVTNCPVASIFLCIELFDGKYLPLYLLACGTAYMMSGYAGLYSEQKILYSKLEPKYIDRTIK